MVRHLVKKEVLNNITDFRFMISSVIALGLVILTTIILSEQYLKQVDQYNEFVNLIKNYDEKEFNYFFHCKEYSDIYFEWLNSHSYWLTPEFRKTLKEQHRVVRQRLKECVF